MRSSNNGIIIAIIFVWKWDIFGNKSQLLGMLYLNLSKRPPFPLLALETSKNNNDELENRWWDNNFFWQHRHIFFSVRRKLNMTTWPVWEAECQCWNLAFPYHDQVHHALCAKILAWKKQMRERIELHSTQSCTSLFSTHFLHILFPQVDISGLNYHNDDDHEWSIPNGLGIGVLCAQNRSSACMKLKGEMDCSFLSNLIT